MEETEALGAQSSKYPGPAHRPGFFKVGPVRIAELQQAPSSDECTSEELYDMSTAEGVHQEGDGKWTLEGTLVQPSFAHICNSKLPRGIADWTKSTSTS